MPSSEYYRDLYGSMAEGRYKPKHAVSQKGNGFFGRIIKGSILPIVKSVLPYLKNIALDGVGGMVSDMKEGKSVKEAAQGQLRRTGSTIASDMATRIRNQAGSGVRRSRRRKRTQRVTRKRKRTQNGRGLRKRASGSRGIFKN